MHPILLRIPLPHMPLKYWWALAAAAVIAVIFGALAARRNDRQGAMIALFIAIGAGIAGYAIRGKVYEGDFVPIYSYGVMLGLSLIVGWYLTLSLAERDGLPKETMANCYVFTAVAAIIGSRILYILTNPDEFKDIPSDWFALRRGGLVAYGGFLGGFLGSWWYLARQKIRLLPWADVAAPALASGLMITRMGCYMFGCDFGTRLPENAPGFLKKLGTFPHWAANTVASGDGSPAYIRHRELFAGRPLGLELAKTNASLPVHPTQIYESLCGLLLLVLVLMTRKNLKFRGQTFLTFVFGYGFLRFLLEIVRDDTERGEYGPAMGEHILIPGALLFMSIAFAYGIALGIKNTRARLIARVVAFVPPIVAYILLKPASFGSTVDTQLSTSQWLGLITALLAAIFYAKYWEEARKSPAIAMALGPGVEEALAREAAARGETAEKQADHDEEDEDEEDDEEEHEEPHAGSDKPVEDPAP